MGKKPKHYFGCRYYVDKVILVRKFYMYSKSTELMAKLNTELTKNSRIGTLVSRKSGDSIVIPNTFVKCLVLKQLPAMPPKDAPDFRVPHYDIASPASTSRDVSGMS